jgi:hypothetical protein
VGKESYEQPLQVRMDKEIRMSDTELRQQFEMSVELRDLQSRVNDALRGLDGLKDQIEERKKIAQTFQKETAADLAKELDKHLEGLAKVQARLARPEGKPFWSEAPRLTDRLAALQSGIDGVNRAPTAAQVEHHRELRGEVASAMAEVDRYLGDSVREVNALLSARQLPPVVAAAR